MHIRMPSALASFPDDYQISRRVYRCQLLSAYHQMTIGCCSSTIMKQSALGCDHRIMLYQNWAV